MKFIGDTTALFGTSGIRGKPNEDFYPDFYLHIALAIGSILGGRRFAIANDGRKTAAMLLGAIASGLTATGHDVVDLGVLPTPALQYYCKTNRIPGIIVTASHNPKEYNGIKVISDNGMDATPDVQEKIESLYSGSNYLERGGNAKTKIKYAKWNEAGRVISDYGAKEAYISAIAGMVDSNAIRSRGLAVLCDCSNGATYETTPMLLRELGIRVIALNSTLDGTFPAHSPEPTRENIKSTIEAAKDHSVDFAVVHDSDGDRVIFVSPDGKYLDGNYSLAIIAKNRLRRGDNVVVPVSTSDIFIDTAKRIGAKIYLTKVGAPVVARKAIELKARLAGEESGGIIFPEHQYCKDGAMGLALFAEAVAKYGLGNLLKSLPDLYYSTDKVHTDKSFDSIKKAVLERKHRDQDFTDGVKVYLNDTDWVMLRPSGTEPVVRIYVQANSREAGERIMEEYKSIAAD